MPRPKKLPATLPPPPKPRKETSQRAKQHAATEARRRRIRAILDRTAKARAEIDAIIGDEPVTHYPAPKSRGIKGKTRSLEHDDDLSETSYPDPAMTLPQARATALLELDIDEDVLFRAELVAEAAGVRLDDLFEAVILRSLPSMKLGQMAYAKCACCPNGRCAKAFVFRGTPRCGCAPLVKRNSASGKSAEKT